MYAIVEIAGQQFKSCEKDQKCMFHRVQDEEGKQRRPLITFFILEDGSGSLRLAPQAIDGAAC